MLRFAPSLLFASIAVALPGLAVVAGIASGMFRTGQGRPSLEDLPMTTKNANLWVWEGKSWRVIATYPSAAEARASAKRSGDPADT